MTTTPVLCTASDLCRHTNTCSFNVIVGPRPLDCMLHLALTPDAVPQVILTWDCAGILQSAPEVPGRWSDLAGAISPHATAAVESQKLFRVKIP